MYTLKGIFPEPKKEQKKNFIKENMKQLKYIQESKSSKESKSTSKGPGMLTAVKSSPSSKSNKLSHVAKSSVSRKKPDMRIKKGDMSEFLKRKEYLKQRQASEREYDDDEKSEDYVGPYKEIGCQTIESNLTQRFEDSTKLTVLYPKKEDAPQASGDFSACRSPPLRPHPSPRRGDEGECERQPYARLNSIIERKTDKNSEKNPYLPAGYQKGVLPKYLRARKDAVREEPAVDDTSCPPGHVALPDAERKETLKMLRNSFAELVNELNKMPVKTDTLRMRNRKMELEKQLAKLEEGIKVFSRPKVFVKIGE